MRYSHFLESSTEKSPCISSVSSREWEYALWSVDHKLRAGVDADDRMCNVRDTDTHPRVRADTPVLILQILLFCVNFSPNPKNRIISVCYKSWNIVHV